MRLLNLSFRLFSQNVSPCFIRRALNISAMTDEINLKRSNDEEIISNKRICVETVANSSDRVKRRKVLLLLGYCGQGYLGMQRNPGFKTIEEDLLTAMLKAKVIDDEAFKYIQSIQFQRAARTDKGVSAVKQVVSLKLPEDAKVESINEHLPECIRIFALKRVTKGFNSKSSCDARTYSYMMPTLAFSENYDEGYRITQDVIDKIRDALQVFTGTHNFHNFTSKKKAQDPSAFRYILNFDCGEPFVKDGMEFITLRIKGQSFMIHQIRKMVGTAIAIVRGLTTSETIMKAWSEPRIDLPMAPGLGLVLEEVHYDRYNAKFGKDGLHELLTWDEFDAEIVAFKEKYIEPIIVETEKKEQSMYNWLLTLPHHSFDIRERHIHQAPNGNSQEDTGSEESEGLSKNDAQTDVLESIPNHDLEDK